MQACESHADCTRQGYRCRAMGDGQRVLHACYPGALPLPDHTAGSACMGDEDCKASSATCAHELPIGGGANSDRAPAPGGHCTQRCSLDAECGSGAQCMNH